MRKTSESRSSNSSKSSKSSKFVQTSTFCLMVLMGSGWGLNPIHEASYALVPQGIVARDFAVYTGALYNPDAEVLTIPVALGLRATPRLELAGGLRTLWLHEGDHLPHLLLGVKYDLPGSAFVEGDLWISTGDDKAHGLALSWFARRGFGRRLSMLWNLKLGMLDLFAHDALFAMEGGLYPALRVGSSVRMELGIIASSQTDAFDEHLAIDLQPGLVVPLGREGILGVYAAMGLAGDRQEDVRLKLVWTIPL